MLDRNDLDWPKMLVSPHDGGLILERLFVLGYGFSAIPAVLMAIAGAGLLQSLLVLWLGGVVGVLAMSVILARPKRTGALAGLTTTDTEQAQEANRLQ